MQKVTFQFSVHFGKSKMSLGIFAVERNASIENLFGIFCFGAKQAKHTLRE
jgi:hypothetical protein